MWGVVRTRGLKRNWGEQRATVEDPHLIRGSGAGSDAFDLQVTDALLERRDRAPKTQDYIARRTEIDYATYSRMRGKLVMK